MVITYRFYVKVIIPKVTDTMKLTSEPRTLDELRQEIATACRNMFIETIQDVCHAVPRRYEKCVAAIWVVILNICKHDVRN